MAENPITKVIYGLPKLYTISTELAACMTRESAPIAACVVSGSALIPTVWCPGQPLSLPVWCLSQPYLCGDSADTGRVA